MTITPEDVLRILHERGAMTSGEVAEALSGRARSSRIVLCRSADNAARVGQLLSLLYAQGLVHRWRSGGKRLWSVGPGVDKKDSSEISTENL